MGRQRYNKQAETEAATIAYSCCHAAICHARTAKNKAEQAPKTKPSEALTNQGGSSLQGHIPAAVLAATNTKTDAKTVPKIDRPAAEKII